MMRCSVCGWENPGSAGRCQNCGKPLFTTPPAKGQATSSAEKAKHAAVRYDSPPPLTDHSEVGRRMQFSYAHGHRDPFMKNLEAIQTLLEHFEKKPIDVNALMKEAANLITKQFGIANVSVGLRDSDGMYRYKVFVGFRPETQEAQAKLSYSLRQFGDDSEYKGTRISKFTRIYLEEDIAQERSDSQIYDHPMLLGSKRLSVDSSLEGDYIDYHILGANGELLGWIETSGTRIGKLPDTTTIRSIEIIASLIGIALSAPEEGRHRN